MRHKTLPIGLALVALLAISSVAAAEVYDVTLVNGNTFFTRFKPRVASWDENKVLLLTEVGNWISLDRQDIAKVEVDTGLRGFGTMIDNATIALGWSPNDAEAPSDEPVDPMARVLDMMERQQQVPVNYSVEQFVEPEDTEGIPVGWARSTTPPMGGVGRR